mgnify:CR=1 FL=1
MLKYTEACNQCIHITHEHFGKFFSLSKSHLIRLIFALNLTFCCPDNPLIRAGLFLQPTPFALYAFKILSRVDDKFILQYVEQTRPDIFLRTDFQGVLGNPDATANIANHATFPIRIRKITVQICGHAVYMNRFV